MEKRKYYQPEIETMPVEEIQKMQSEKLVKQVNHVYKNVPYYRDLMDKKGIKVLSIPSAELSRGRGGPRCMSCPVNRIDL